MIPKHTEVGALRLRADKADLSMGRGIRCPWDVEDCNTVIVTPDGTEAVGIAVPSLVVDMSDQHGRDDRFSVVIARAVSSQS